MTVEEAIDNALNLLESLGYKGGDIHLDLVAVHSHLELRHPDVLVEKLPE